MSRLTIAVIAALLASEAGAATRVERGNLVLENIPAMPSERSVLLENYLQARSASFVDWLPDGSMLITTRFADTAQLHRVSQPLGSREQLTFSREPVSVARAPQVPNAAAFVFFRDQGGDENSQLYAYDLATRMTKLLTDGRSRHTSAVWSHDGRRIAFAGNGRDGVSMDIYVAEVPSTLPPRLLVNGMSKTWTVLDWSPDGTRILIENIVSVNEGYVFSVDAVSGVMTPIDPAAERVGIVDARFSPDGRAVYLISDRGSEFAQLRRVDLVTGAATILTAHIPWDIDKFDVSRDGRYLFYVANADGYSQPTLVDLISQQEISVPLARAQIGGAKFDRSGTRLALSVQTAIAPADVWVLDIGRNALTRWTQSEIGPVDASKFVDAELIRYPTFDRVAGRQRQIPAFVYRPRAPGPHPVIIDIHGGPEGQSTPDFRAFTQFLVNELGCIVIQPNVRGSTGYGKSYVLLDNGRLREDSVKDIGTLLVWVGQQRDMDAKRVIVMGGSYGGYMTLASLVHFGDRLLGGVNTVGISNFVTFLQNTSAYRRDLRRVEYGDERDPKTRAFLQRISPTNNAARIKKPLLIVQGLNDPRVPASESEQMVAKIRAQGGEVWYLAAKDEGHGFRKKANRDFYLQTVAQFIAQHVGGKAP
jgi:dipeptidyl aminopeptidase/acylaminoacyl peptidase